MGPKAFYRAQATQKYMRYLGKQKACKFNAEAFDARVTVEANGTVRYSVKLEDGLIVSVELADDTKDLIARTRLRTVNLTSVSTDPATLTTVLDYFKGLALTTVYLQTRSLRAEVIRSLIERTKPSTLWLRDRLFLFDVCFPDAVIDPGYAVNAIGLYGLPKEKALSIMPVLKNTYKEVRMVVHVYKPLIKTYLQEYGAILQSFLNTRPSDRPLFVIVQLQSNALWLPTIAIAYQEYAPGNPDYDMYFKERYGEEALARFSNN